MTEQDRRVESITGVMEFDDGQKVEFSIGRELDSRWGNTQAVIADAVEPCEVIIDALIDHDLLARSDEDDDEVPPAATSLAEAQAAVDRFFSTPAFPGGGE